jgi:hypothetical protein
MSRSGIQNVLSRAGLRAVGEARLAFLAAPRIIRPVAVVAVWSATAILLGMIVGLAAVILPPTGAFGIVAMVALVFLWVMPDLPAIPDRIVRRLFFVVLVVDLCLPNYYAIDLPGLPWVSARRIVTFPLILLFAIAYAGSSETRKTIATVLRGSRFVTVCVFGYLGMTIISIFTSIHPSGSLSQVTDLFLESYVPFLAILYVVRKEEDVYTLIRTLCWCAVVISLAGAADFKLQSHVYLDLLPKSLVNELAAANPFFVDMLRPMFRNGMYRANSVFNVSLSFGEFEAIIAPLALYLVIYSDSLRDRLLGSALAVLCPAGIFFSGSRGAYLAYGIATSAFVVGWVIRNRRLRPHHLGVAIAGLMGAMAFAFVIALVMFSKRAHNIVFGGGMEAYSDEARLIQWRLAWPHILANPVTGHGYATAGDVIGNFLGANAGGIASVDSWLVSSLVETGVPGFVFFFGMAIFGAWRGMRLFLFEASKEAAAAGALASSLMAFVAQRFVLSQRESFTTIFVIIACIIFLDHYHAVQTKTTPRGIKVDSGAVQPATPRRRSAAPA